jgi:transcriptional regulator with XRE-family HTH domain
MRPRSADLVAVAISELLDRERQRQGLSLLALATRAGLADGTVRAALDGHTARTATFATLAQTLGVTLTVALAQNPRRLDTVC